MTEARLCKLKYFFFYPEDFEDWEKDITQLTEPQLRHRSYIEFFECFVDEYPVAGAWIRYIDYLLKTKTDPEEPNVVSTVFERALECASLDYKDAGSVYTRYLDHAINTLEKTGASEVFWRRVAAFMNVPHMELERTYQKISENAQKLFPNGSEARMSVVPEPGSWDREIRLEDHEREVWRDSNGSPDPVAWCKYIGFYLALLPKTGRLLLARSILENRDGREQWQSVWKQYCHNRFVDANVTHKDLYVVIRACPDMADGYEAYIRRCSNFGESYFDGILARVRAMELWKSMEYQEWKAIALAVLTHEYKSGQQMPVHLKQYVDIAFQNNDVFHSVEKLAVSILHLNHDDTHENKIVKRLLERFSDQCEIWLYVAEQYRLNGAGHEQMSRFFLDAIESASKMDWPERIIAEALAYELVHGTSDSYAFMHFNAAEQMKAIKEDEEEGEVRENVDGLVAASPPPAVPAAPTTEPTRNREHHKVKMENVPKAATEKEIKRLFQDCGEIAELHVRESGDLKEAALEFLTEQAYLAALTKDKKKLHGSLVLVKPLHGAIVWVSNFPPSMSQSELRDVFSDCGPIVSARFPSLTGGKSRRFCYLEFSSPEAASHAVEAHNNQKLLDKISEKKFKMVVAISRPPKKEDTKHSAMHRQVCVKNLDYQTSEEALRAVFETYGVVESVALPIKQEMRARGFKNGGFAFVTFETEAAARKSLNANGVSIANRKVNVHRAQVQQPDTYRPFDFDDTRSISISGISDSCRQEQLEAFLAERFGAVSKVHVDHSSGSAVVEFVDPDTTKRALEIETAGFDGNTLKVSAKSSFGAPKSQDRPRKQRLMLPTAVARKKQKTS